MIQYRKYRMEDCLPITNLFYETVHTINAKDYTQQQRDVWATGKINLNEWNLSFLKNTTWVAVKDSILVGFGDMDTTGYLDRLYVHKNFQRQGIATAICDRLEKECVCVKIITHASITAKPFFEKRGYKTIKKQGVWRQGIYLENYSMEKEMIRGI